MRTGYLRSLGTLPTWAFRSVITLVGNFPTLDAIGGGPAGRWRRWLDALDIATATIALAAVVVGYATLRARRGSGPTTALAACIGISLILMVANSVLIDFQPQGRYLLVAAPAAAILAVSAGARLLQRLSVRPRRMVIAAVVLGVVVLNATAFETMRQLAARVS